MTPPKEFDSFTLEEEFPHDKNIFFSVRWFDRDGEAKNFKNNKNKFYHLHVPKTAGNYIRSELTYDLEETFKENDIAFVVGHLGWIDYIDQYTYVFNTFRDPVKRTVSHFTFMTGFPEYQQEGIFIEDLKNPTVKDLMGWVEAHPEYINNYQAKNLLFSAPPVGSDIPNNFFFFKEPGFLSLQMDEPKVWERAKATDLMLRDNQLTNENMVQVKKDIFDDFGISQSSNRHPMEDYKWHNITDRSKALYEKLSQSEKDYLEQINNIDSELYNTDSLYWKEGK